MYFISELSELQQSFAKLHGLDKRLEKEMEEVFRADSEIVLLLYIRRSLEIIIEKLVTEKLKRSRGTEPLNGLIEKLNP